jgi:ABC-type dipeptide/oligopeptide/nickel transport system ATPase subunit
MSRVFKAEDAVRRSVDLFIGLVGPSSSGKTMSALRLATGIQSVVGGDIHLIDTENRRATHYASMYKFKHVQFDPPYSSLDYAEALRQSVAAGAKTIIIDSASHEHESDGGMIDFQEKELTRMAGDDYAKRERMAMLAWAKPKAARRKFLRQVIGSNANIIMLFRAKHISKPIKGPDGKTKIVDMGFVPIAGEEFVFEMQLSALLLPGCQGIPTWKPDNPGEKMAVKLPVQFKDMIRDGEAITEDLGMRLATWAKGDAPKAPESAPVKLSDFQFALATCDTVDDLKATWKDYETRINEADLLDAQKAYKDQLAKIKASTTAAQSE